MSRRLLLPTVVMVLSAVSLMPTITAQTLYGVDGAGTSVFEFAATAPGPPCGQPNPSGVGPWPYFVPSPCGGGPVGPFLGPPAGFWGDIAVNTLTDTVYVTDGFVIGEYVGDPACGALPPAGTMINLFAGPAPMIGLTGMGMDSAAGILWITDGSLIAGIIPPPPLSCLAPVVVFAPFFHGISGAGLLTDIDWDPFGNTLWACDTLGLVHNIAVGGGPGPCGTFPVVPGPCFPAGTVLHGLAYDRSTPGVGSPIQRFFVTDGFTIAYVDIGGAPAAPPGNFYAPTPCSPWPGPPTSGLALASHGITYGAPRVGTTINSFGQSTLGSATFGIEITGTAPGSTVFVIVNFSTPGPGFFCPGVAAGGTTLWVDPGPPGTVVTLGPLPPGCFALPAALPATAALNGLTIFVQAIDVPAGGLPAVDATEGLAITLMVP